MELQPVRTSQLAGRRLAQVRLPAQSDAPPAGDGYRGSVEETAPVVLPPLLEPEAKDLGRGYLWQAVPLPGPVDAVLGAVLGFGPIPRWMGLEPAPRGKPDPQPLGFSWTGSDAITFSEKTAGLEKMLRDPTATEAGKRALKGGSNSNYLVTLDNGVSAIWTPSRGEKSATEFHPNIPDGTQARREEAAYLVDKRLGHLARVPPAVASGLEGRPGALKLLVPQGRDAAASKVEDPTALLPAEDYRRIALFDHVIGNLDRHLGNFLTDAEGKPIPIDHGLAFPTRNGPQGHNNFRFHNTFVLNQKERDALTDFSKQRKEVERELEGLLEPEAIDSMFARVDRMLELGCVTHEWRQ